MRLSHTNKQNLILVFLVFLSMINKSTIAQENDTVDRQAKQFRFGAIPFLGYAPETRISGGITGFILRTGDTTTHNSTLYFLAGISQNKQYTLNMMPDIWLQNNQYHLTGELKWQYWPDKFFGLGNQTQDSLKESYTSKIKGIKLDLFRQFRPGLYMGPLIEIEHNDLTEYDDLPHAVLPGGDIPGSDQSFIIGIGAGIARDTRDNIIYPVKGSFHQLRVVYFRNNYETGKGYVKTIIDFRKYIPLGREHLLRFQGYAKFQFGSDIPFRNLSLLGGSNLMRGYFQGRYRDNHIIALQAEYHTPYFWRFSGVFFTGIADVLGSYSDNQFAEIKPSAGVGLRFAILPDNKMNLRIDAGLGRGDHGIYFNMMEAF